MPDFVLYTLVMFSILCTSFTVYYIWNSSFSKMPSAHFIWDQPDKTIFTINILSYFATILINNLIFATCDQFRWKNSCCEDGMPFLSFLALSSGTSLTGLIHLLLNPFSKLSLRSIGYRWWVIQRYFYFPCSVC
jgi:hypothetical protein